MLRLSKMTDYGTVVLADMAGNPDAVHTATDVAERTRLGPPTVAKVLKLLSRGGLVDSYRGAHGGYALARPAEDISAADIIDAIEGPVAITECSTEESQCELESFCAIGVNWRRLNQAIHASLREVTLAQLAEPGARLPEPKLGKFLAGGREFPVKVEHHG